MKLEDGKQIEGTISSYKGGTCFIFCSLYRYLGLCPNMFYRNFKCNHPFRGVYINCKIVNNFHSPVYVSGDKVRKLVVHFCIL
jgi:hypothetical protein